MENKPVVIKVGDTYLLSDDKNISLQQTKQGMETLVESAHGEMQYAKDLKEYSFYQVFTELVRQFCVLPTINYDEYKDVHHLLTVNEDGTVIVGD